MIVHMEDKGEINILIDDKGAMVAICPICKRIWTGQFSISEKETTPQVNRSLRRNLKIKDNIALKNLQQTMPILVTTAKEDSSFLKKVGMDIESINKLAE